MPEAGVIAPALPQQFIDELRKAFAERAQDGLAIREQHGASESHIEPALPDVVVFAKTTEEVSVLVRF